jgi:DNA-binding transcriptional regulator YhcF (GntR family)
MIATDTEFYSSPYYFLLRDKGSKYSLYFSVEGNLTEARKKDEVIHFEKSKGEKVKKHLKKVAKEKKIKDTKTLKKDLEELVNADGAMSNSAIPILDPKLHPRKTMDQTVAASRITNDPISRGYRTYYGESEMKEIDMSGAFGYEETEDMDGKDTYKYLVKDMGMEPDDAKERTKQQGKDPSGKKDKKSKYYRDKNFITRATLSEIQRQKAIKMVEDLLTKKNSDNSEVGKKVNADSIDELPLLIRKNLKSLLNNVEKHGFSKEDIIKLIKKGE